MSDIFREIETIKRPRALMNAAKDMVKMLSANHANALSRSAIDKLISTELEYEEQRQRGDFQYHAQGHIEVLAKLITEVVNKRKERKSCYI